MHAELTVFGLPLSFLLFGLILLGIALFHHHTLRITILGLGVLIGYKWGFPGFEDGPGWVGLQAEIAHEWVILANLFGLLTGFAILARHFEKTRWPVIIPKWLPDDWKGGFALLALVFFLSGFLDNIAGAMIGGAMAHALFQGRVHIAFLAAIVASANAGGAGSVIGDTTTTMIWLKGISPLAVLEAYLPALVSLFILGIPAAITQQRHSPIIKNAHTHTHVDWPRTLIVALLLLAVIGTNIAFHLLAPQHAESFPWIGLAIWTVIIASAPVRRPDWEVLPEAASGALFLLCLVFAAALMPIENLPPPSWQNTFWLGFISSVFDNIPLTALALAQGGYDWGFVAFAVGFGGSMIWFGSSAGVALSGLYPEIRSVWSWLRHGWPILLGYGAGYLTLLLTSGWHPQ